MPSVIVYRASGDALERLPIQASSLDEATLQTAHGVYTVLRLYPGRRVLRLVSHFARLRRSAELLGRPFLLMDDWLRQTLRRAVEVSHLDPVRMRLTVPFDAPNSAIVALEPFVPPSPMLYQKGVNVGLVEGKRESPRAKNSQFIQCRQKIEAGRSGDTYETVLHDSEGVIFEGLTSNFYAVLDDQLRTADENVLEGVARAVLLGVASAVLPVVLSPIRIADIPRVSEAMLTSSSRGVVPVVRTGNVVIGEGRPGPVVQALQAAYNAQVERELEPL